MIHIDKIWDRLSQKQQDELEEITRIKKQADEETDPSKRDYLLALAAALATSWARDLAFDGIVPADTE